MTVDRLAQFDLEERSELQHELVGRDDELSRLEELVTGEARLVTLTGPPGVGKSHLAAVLAERLHGRRFSDVRYLELRAVESLREFRRTVARELGVEQGDGLEERLVRAIENRGDFLVILDEVEALAADGELRGAFQNCLRQWRERAASLRIVVCSRRRVGVAEGHCFDLPPLEGRSAVELFERRARRVRNGFAVDDANREAIRRIVDLLDGLPQAIELAASRCRVLGPQQLLERLDRRDDGESVQRSGVLSPLERALEELWSTLPEWARRAGAQLRTFRGSFSPERAERLLELGADAPSELEALEFLVDRSILGTTSSSESSDLRFEMLRTVRRFVSETDEAADDEVDRRHAEIYADRCLEWWRQRGTSEAPRAKRDLAYAHSQIAAAFDRALDRGWPCAVALAFGLIARYTDSKQFGAAASVFERLEASSVEPRGERSRARYAYADAYLTAAPGDFAAAVERASDALEAAERADAQLLAARIEFLFVEAAALEGNFDEALEHLERVDERLRAHSGVSDRIHARQNYARVYRAMGDQGTAEKHIREALESARRHDLKRRRMRVRLHLGLLYSEREDFDEALEHVGVAAALNEELPPWEHESTVTSVAGSVYHAAGRLDRAETLYERGIRAKRRKGDVGPVADGLTEFGLLILERNDPGRARQCFVEARRAASSSHRRCGFDLFGAQRLGLALSHALEGRLETARREFEKVEQRVEKLEKQQCSEEDDIPDLLPAMAQFGGAILELRGLRAAAGAGEITAATIEERLEGVRERVDAVEEAPASFNGYVSLRRMAGLELERARREIRGDGKNSGVGRRLQVGPDFGWFEVDDGPREDLTRRGALRRVLASLVEAREEAGSKGAARSVFELLEAGWSEEPADPDSGKSRVYTTIRRLRDMGLDEILETVEEGYRLHPDVAIERA